MAKSPKFVSTSIPPIGLMTRPVHSQPQFAGHQTTKCDPKTCLNDTPSEGENEDGCTSSFLRHGQRVEDASIYAVEAAQEMEGLPKERELCTSQSDPDTRVSGYWTGLLPVVSLLDIPSCLCRSYCHCSPFTVSVNNTFVSLRFVRPTRELESRHHGAFLLLYLDPTTSFPYCP